MATKIILDPGHGGYDSGASYQGRREKDDVLQLAFDVGSNLERLGYEVDYTRTSDVYDSPNQKARIGNASGADFFISLHRNSSVNPNQYTGVETLLYSDTGVKADMARNINLQLEEVGFKNLGVDERKDLAVLRRTNMPALLLEVGFINNDADNQLYDANQARIAEAIARGIDETLNGTGATEVMSENFSNDYYGYNTSMPVFADNNTAMEQEQDAQIIYQVLVSIFRNMGMASFMMNQLINSGFDATANEVDGLYQVRVGAFENIEDALAIQDQLRKRGYETLIVTYENNGIS